MDTPQPDGYAEIGHLDAALRATQHGHEGDEKDLDEFVPRVAGPRVRNLRERRDEQLHCDLPDGSGDPPRIHNSLNRNPNPALLQTRFPWHFSGRLTGRSRRRRLAADCNDEE
jgi:hypothetical protein